MQAITGNGVAVLLGLLALVPLARADFPAPVPLDAGGFSRDPVHAGAIDLAVSPNGEQIYLLEEDSDNDLAVVARDPGTGRLGLADVSGLEVSSVGHSLAMAPDGRHLYVGHSSGNQGGTLLLEIVTRDPLTGAISHGPAGPTTPQYATTRGITVSPDNEHLYLADDTFPGNVRVFDRDPLTGALSPVEVETNGVGGVSGLSSPFALVVSPDGAHVYVASFQTIAVFARNASTGGLTFVEFLQQGVGGVSGLDGVSGIAVSPDGAHVFASDRSPGSVAVFSRNASTGVLTFVEVQQDGVGAVTGLGGAGALITSTDGARVYVATGAGVVIFARNAGTGALTFVAFQPRAGVGAGALAFGPGDDQVYVAGSHGVAHFDRDSGTGLLTSIGAVVTGGPRALAISPDGEHVYASGGPFTYNNALSFVSVFARDTGDGSVDYVESQVDGAAGVPNLDGASDLAVSPDGAHVYATAAVDDAVTVFARAVPAGTLTLVETQQDGVAGVDGLDGARSVGISPDGAHVYVASDSDDALAVFARNAGTGALTFVEAQRDGVAGVDGLGDLLQVEVSPDGAHVYALSSGSEQAIAIFARNPVSGALTFLTAARDGAGGLSGLDTLGSMAISPDGSNVYVRAGGFGDYMLTVLARNASTGILSFVETLEEGPGEIYGGEPIVVSPDGTHVYVGRGIVYARDAGTGALRFVNAAGVFGFSFNLYTAAVAVSPDGRHLYSAANPGFSLSPSNPGIVRYSTQGFSGCGPAPLAGCRAPGRGRLRILTSGGAQLVWSWARGAATDLADLGSPRTTSTHYALCFYEGASPVLTLRALAPAGGHCRRQPSNADPSCWKESRKGFNYRDDFASPEGLYTIQLKSGTAGKAAIKAKAMGEKLKLPTLPLTLPLRVQLQAANGECWETVHTDANVNDGGRVISPAD